MKKILILEDNEAHMKALVKILSEINDIQIFEAYNMAEANYMLSLNVFDVFLVDIILDTKVAGDVSGIDFVNKLRENKRYQYAPVIFITSLEDPKLAAYKELHCYNYIEKPFDPGEVMKTVEEALEIPMPSPKREYVYFRKDGILYSVKVEEIIYIVANRHGVEIHTTKDCLKLSYRPMAEILKELESSEFLQCNRSMVVNKNYIEHFDLTNRYIKLKETDVAVEMGSSMKKLFKDML